MYPFSARMVAAVAALVLTASPSIAANLLLDGSVAGPAVCPNGGTPVDRLCSINGVAVANNGCRYGGEKTFDAVSLVNGATLCVTPYDGSDRTNTGNLVIKAASISVDATSRVVAKGAGYRGLTCNDGEGPAFAPSGGGRGGCSVIDSGGGGAHFGSGGVGTKDCFLVGPSTTCSVPQEIEEDCGNNTGSACVSAADPDKPVCYGTSNLPDGSGDGLPSVAGVSYEHGIYEIELGSAGGDKGCRDSYDSSLRAGRGGGRIVLFAATAAQDGVVDIAGAINANGHRGCASANDSAGGGAGGSILIAGDQVDISATARIGAAGGRGGDTQPKCLSCISSAQCQAGQICQSGRCSPCNCTPCTSNAQCDAGAGQTCKALGGDLGSVCADASNRCSSFDSLDNENECIGTQNSGTCDDCGGGGGGGFIVVQARSVAIDPLATIDVSGGSGGICPICASVASGTAGVDMTNEVYAGEVCDGWDNDFDGQTDEDLGTINCADSSTIPACVDATPQVCPPTPTPTITSTPTVTPTPAAGCPSVPASCASAGKSSLSIKIGADPGKSKLSWKWSKGVLPAAQVDFGDPVGSAPSYRLCVYDQTAGSPVLKAGMSLSAGGICGTKPCWKALSDKGWAYADRDAHSSGIAKLKFKSGEAGKPSLSIAGKGANLPLPTPHSSTELFDQDTSVIVQFHTSSPANCWSSTFELSGTKKNEATQVTAR